MPTSFDSLEGSPPDCSPSVKPNRLPPASVLWMMAGASFLFFLCSSLRHILFQSTGFDLGIYDQVTYLISQGQPPISSILGFHHLGNHGAWAIYPLGLLYKIYPSVYWLFGMQALVLALGAWPTWSLAQQAGLDQPLSRAIAAAYLLYPVVFNVNLFDFHPEVMALPALLGAVLAARLGKFPWFCLAILWVLGCKAVLSLTVIALGFWLFFYEKRRKFGGFALAAGCAWFILVTQVMIPNFSGQEAEGVWRYAYLGNSVLEIITNLILKPQLVLGRLFSMPTLDYLYKLSLPFIGWLSPWSLTSLIPVIPTLMINSLSDVSLQRSLAFQYSIPAIPFLLLAVIASFQQQDWTLGKWGWNLWSRMRSGHQYQLPDRSKQELSRSPDFNASLPRLIVLWSLLIFVFYGKYVRFWIYFQRLDTLQANRAAIAQINPQETVLTDNYLAPHLTHRFNLKLLSQITPESNLTEFDAILLNLRHPWPDTIETGVNLVQKLENGSGFKVIYTKKDVIVFRRDSV
ncbi:MAG: DUF2079 domain-containing protein [Microcoleaceae cyanobacterium]